MVPQLANQFESIAPRSDIAAQDPGGAIARLQEQLQSLDQIPGAGHQQREPLGHRLATHLQGEGQVTGTRVRVSPQIPQQVARLRVQAVGVAGREQDQLGLVRFDLGLGVR